MLSLRRSLREMLIVAVLVVKGGKQSQLLVLQIKAGARTGV